jgi:hypothetical protein
MGRACIDRIIERGLAQRCVDTSRWLYNQIEGMPDRTRLREVDTRKSIGLATMSLHFPASFEVGKVLLHQRRPSCQSIKTKRGGLLRSVASGGQLAPTASEPAPH